MPLNNFRQIHMPYCIKKNEDGAYIVLNREYKPLGFSDGRHVNYEDYPIAVKYKISKVTAKKISYDGSENTDRIYLYNDGCLPERSKKNMDSYLEKLRILAKFQRTD